MEGRNKMLKEEMEMRIAICDDEKIALEQTCNIVKDVFDEMHLKYFIDVYMDANELLQNKDQYDIVFLDIELKDSDKNGVWVAKMIKRYYPESIIIFTTNYEEIDINGYSDFIDVFCNNGFCKWNRDRRRDCEL